MKIVVLGRCERKELVATARDRGVGESVKRVNTEKSSGEK